MELFAQPNVLFAAFSKTTKKKMDSESQKYFVSSLALTSYLTRRSRSQKIRKKRRSQKNQKRNNKRSNKKPPRRQSRKFKSSK